MGECPSYNPVAEWPNAAKDIEPMIAAPLPPDEDTRIQSLHYLRVLDTAPEPQFDVLVRAAALACGVPVSLISLVDTDRQWFKANTGLPEATQTPRDLAFCAHAIQSDGVFEVPDASSDKRFADNPLVTGAPDIRFYAGAPLCLSDGSRVGTLCVIGRQPKTLTKNQREVLTELALAASLALEGRRALLFERELLETQSRSAAMFQCSMDAIIGLTIGGTITHWNVAAERLLGHRESEIIGRSVNVLLPPNEQSVEDLIARVRFQPNGATYEAERVHKDGHLIPVSISAAPLLGADGQLASVTKIVRDMRERVATMQALARSEARFRSLCECAPLGIFSTDPQGGCTYTNERWQEIFGLSQATSLGHGWSATLHPDDKRAVIIEWNRAAALRLEFDMSFRLQPTDMAVRHVHARARPTYGPNKTISGFVGSVEDVSELHALRIKIASLGGQSGTG